MENNIYCVHSELSTCNSKQCLPLYDPTCYNTPDTVPTSPWCLQEERLDSRIQFLFAVVTVPTMRMDLYQPVRALCMSFQVELYKEEKWLTNKPGYQGFKLSDSQSNIPYNSHTVKLSIKPLGLLLCKNGIFGRGFFVKSNFRGRDLIDHLLSFWSEFLLNWHSKCNAI